MKTGLGEGLSLHGVTHARPCQKPDTCHGIWDPSEAPSAPEISLPSRQTGVQGHRWRVLRGTARFPGTRLPFPSLSRTWVSRQKKLEGHCSGHPEALRAECYRVPPPRDALLPTF